MRFAKTTMLNIILHNFFSVLNYKKKAKKVVLALSDHSQRITALFEISSWHMQ